MSGVNIVLLLYGLLNLALGIEAFIAKQSVMSLLGGGLAGIIVLAMLALKPKYPRVANIVCLIVAIAILGRFLPAYLKDTSKTYPNLVLVLASAIVIVVLAAGHFATMGRKRV